MKIYTIIGCISVLLYLFVGVVFFEFGRQICYIIFPFITIIGGIIGSIFDMNAEAKKLESKRYS